MRPEDLSADAANRAQARLIYRWDLDKTYLCTDFDSLAGLVRSALEPASHKRTMPGAQVLLRALSSREDTDIFILSGSPEQMRRVLEEKLRLDGVRFGEFVLKPSLARLLRGQFRFIHDQLAYKLGALLKARLSAHPGAQEILFGDDAEADAFVYSLYSDLCAGRLDAVTLERVLVSAQSYESDVRELTQLAKTLPHADVVQRIFIHLERVEPSEVFLGFGPRVCAFHNYFQPALVLLEDDLLSAEAALSVGLSLVRTHAFSPEALSASVVDLARRGLISSVVRTRLLPILSELHPLERGGEIALLALRQALESLDGRPTRPSRVAAPALDYFELLPHDRARAREAKRRDRARRR